MNQNLVNVVSLVVMLQGVLQQRMADVMLIGILVLIPVVRSF